jgi:signal transduction histidine kinase
MHFDDRLATVLRHRAASGRAARTQFRQLVDLLDAPRGGRESSQLASAWLRLGALGEAIPAGERAAMLRDPAVRIRNAELVAHLAEDEPEVAAAALVRARLDEDDWEALIPRLPIRARGFLRLRRDLPERARELLERLGIHDRGLPTPAPLAGANDDGEPFATAETTTAPIAEDSEIGALVKRIEQFRLARSSSPPSPDDPRLPLGDRAAEADRPAPRAIAFTTDRDGRIDWAEPALAPALVGTRLEEAGRGAALAIAARQPIVAAAVTLEGARAIAGDWIVDAAPRFGESSGNFLGHVGCLRRPAGDEAAPDTPPAPSESDRIRQLLHELRTPVGAIQGFAEVIQQQLFGPVPHEYRAHAAAIVGDSARVLAGFDELDRLARLEGGVLALEPGACDFAGIVTRLASQLQLVLDPRMAAFTVVMADGEAPVPLTRPDGEGLAWRVLATIAGAAGAGEQMALSLARSAEEMVLGCELPATLAAEKDVFAATARAASGSLSAGAFGAGFTLRLARAEAVAAGGSLARVDDTLLLVLPLLTAPGTVLSGTREDRGMEAG